MKSRAERQAERDASVGVNTVDHLLTSRHGIVPEFDPIGNMEHARISSDLQGAPIDELRENIQRVEDEQTLHETSSSLTVKLVACYVAEVLGCTLLFRGLGFNGIERLVPAILFASFLFWITSETKRQGGATRSPWFKVTIAAYALVMLSVTILRTLQAGNEDGSRAEELAIGVVMLATTCGGAVLAESLMSRRGPAVRLAKERRNLRRRLRDAERLQRRAQSYVETFERTRVRQRERIARDRASYLGTHDYITKKEDQ